MALAGNQQQFFNHVLAKDYPATLAKIPVLVNDHHVVFDIQLYSITATINGKGSVVHLKASTNSMMKAPMMSLHPDMPVEVLTSQKMVAGFIDSYYEKVTGLHVVKPLLNVPVMGQPMKFMDPIKLMPGNLTKGIAAAVDGGDEPGAMTVGKTLVGGMDLEQAAAVAKEAEPPLADKLAWIKWYRAKYGVGYSAASMAHTKSVEAKLTVQVDLEKLVESVAADGTGLEKALESVSKQPACKPGVIKLADAEALGQKVYGTSEGSIYRLIAANERVKVAARIKGHQVSIRVETKGALVPELQRIKNSGVIWHEQGYGSMHLGCAGVPIPKVLGAYLYGLGIHFDRVLAPGEEVPA